MLRSSRLLHSFARGLNVQVRSFIAPQTIEYHTKSPYPAIHHYQWTHLYSTDSRAHGTRDNVKDFYSILAISPKATQRQVKDAYYKLSMKYHPDRNKGSEEAHQNFTDLTEAYSVLGQFERRRKYDKGLLHDYPKRPHTYHRYEGHSYAASGTTPHGTVDKSKVKYDFDEFYRAHYGDALKRQREKAKTKDKERKKGHIYSMEVSTQQLWIVVAILATLATGWYAHKFMRTKAVSSVPKQKT